MNHLKPGTILQSRVFPSMQAVVEEELQPDFYRWRLARPAKDGQSFIPYSPFRFSEIDALSWEVKP